MQSVDREGSRAFYPAPATAVLSEQERDNERAGHENAGFLSASHGFLPRTAPLVRLSEPFRAWDELAAQLPSLHRSLELRRAVAPLPVLDAAQDVLSDAEALRACALLAILSHAYWYVEPAPPSALPLALSQPWAQLRARLGREQEVLSYIDLVVYNWRLRDPRQGMVVENLDLLLPTVGNDEERIFYLTQLEILARARPVAKLVSSAQDAVLQGHDAALEATLAALIEVLGAIVREALPKIDPRPRSATYMSPVVWAKTVAPFAVPFRPGLQGPSGTSSPLFNTLDLFFGRKDYESFLGREIKQLRGTYPRAWRRFLAALTEVSVADYVRRSASRPVREAWREALELYAGSDGFLGRHRMKVYGFLELAFKVGRSVTIGGFSGVFRDRTWNVVDDALEASRAERAQPEPHAPQRSADRSVTTHCENVYDYSEIAQHNDAEHGYWMVLAGGVYDVSELMRVHPGGTRILQLYAGMDASVGFARAHAGRAHVATMRERYRIGVVRDPVLEGEIAILYRAFASTLQLVVEMQNALSAEQSLQTERLARGDDPLAQTPYKLARALETHRRFLVEYLALLASETLPELLRLSRAVLPDNAPVDYALERMEIADCPYALDAGQCAVVEELDRALLASIKAALSGALRAIEQHGALVRQLGASDVCACFTRIDALVRDYAAINRRARAAECT